MPQVKFDFFFLKKTFYIIEKSREHFDRNNEALMNPVQCTVVDLKELPATEDYPVYAT